MLTNQIALVDYREQTFGFFDHGFAQYLHFAQYSELISTLQCTVWRWCMQSHFLVQPNLGYVELEVWQYCQEFIASISISPTIAIMYYWLTYNLIFSFTSPHNTQTIVHTVPHMSPSYSGLSFGIIHRWIRLSDLRIFIGESLSRSHKDISIYSMDISNAPNTSETDKVMAY